MLAQKYRFRGLGSVRSVLKYGQAARDELFTIKVLPRRRGTDSRASIVVSRKTAKGAVLRNRIRRRLYEILRLNWQTLSAPTDVAVIVHNSAVARLEQHELEDRLIGTLNKALARLTKADKSTQPEG